MNFSPNLFRLTLPPSITKAADFSCNLYIQQIPIKSKWWCIQGNRLHLTFWDAGMKYNKGWWNLGIGHCWHLPSLPTSPCSVSWEAGRAWGPVPGCNRSQREKGSPFWWEGGYPGACLRPPGDTWWRSSPRCSWHKCPSPPGQCCKGRSPSAHACGRNSGMYKKKQRIDLKVLQCLQKWPQNT